MWFLQNNQCRSDIDRYKNVVGTLMEDNYANVQHPQFRRQLANACVTCYTPSFASSCFPDILAVITSSMPSRYANIGNRNFIIDYRCLASRDENTDHNWKFSARGTPEPILNDPWNVRGRVTTALPTRGMKKVRSDTMNKVKWRVYGLTNERPASIIYHTPAEILR